MSGFLPPLTVLNQIQKVANSSFKKEIFLYFSDAKIDLALIKDKKSDLPAVFTLKTKPEQTSSILKSDNKRERLTSGIAGFLRDSGFDGVEINFEFNSQDVATKESLTAFLKVS